MRRYILSGIGLLFSIFSFSQNDILTNKSILDLRAIGLSDGVIIAKIKSSESDFDTSVESLKRLKEAGVSDSILMEMIGTSKSDIVPQDAVSDKLGIYVMEEDVYRKIYPTAFIGKSVSTLGVALSFGLADADVVSSIQGAHSHNKLDKNRPEFHFFFERSNTSSNNIFQIASSPYEFILARLESNNDTRHLVTGSANAYAGQKIGVNPESIIKFKVSPVSETEFVVTPETPLPAGEYCFLYQGTIPQGNSPAQLVYDFSIPLIKKLNPKYKIGDTVWMKGLIMPSEVEIIQVKESRGLIVYTVRSKNTGIEEEVIESNCYLSSDEAKDVKKPKYKELEEAYLRLKIDSEKKIADYQNYIKELQGIIDSLNQQLNEK